MTKRNLDFRAAAKASGVCLWEIAEKLNISEPTFSRWLRKELSDGWKQKIMAAIDEIKAENSSRYEDDCNINCGVSYAVNSNN